MKWVKFFCIISIITQLVFAGSVTDTHDDNQVLINPNVGDASDDWTLELGNISGWNESGSLLSFTGDGNFGQLINNYGAADNGILTVNMTNGGNSGGIAKQGGVIARWQNTTSFYYFYTFFTFDSLFVFVNKGNTQFDAVPDTSFKAGSVYTGTDANIFELKIQAVDSNFTIIVNDETLGVYIDSDYSSGRFGYGRDDAWEPNHIKFHDISWVDITTPPTVSTPIPDTTINEDAAAINYRDLHTAFDDVEDSSTLTFSLSTNNTDLLTLSLDGTGDTLIITPLSDSNGTADIYVTASDGGSTVSDTFTVTVTAVNDLPIGANDTITTDEDVNYTFAPSDFTFSDKESGAISGIRIFTGENAGDLEYNGADVVNGTVISDITKLVFKPDPDSNGIPYALFTFEVYDGSDYSSSAYIMTIDVTPVNDVPTTAGVTKTTLEDEIYTFSVSDFPYSDIEGDTLVRILTTLSPIIGTLWIDLNSNGIYDGASELVTESNANKWVLKNDIPKLKYTPMTDATGDSLDLILFRVDDDLNDADYSTSETFYFCHTAVNDEPSFTAGADQTVLEDAGAQIVTGWASSISKGPVDEAGQTLTFTVTNNNNSLFTVQPALDTAGKLTYTPTPDSNGTATVDVILSDNGGTANGGDDTYPTQQFTITVNAQNDSPTIVAPIADTTLLEDFSPVNFRDLNAVFTDVEDGSALTFTVTSLQSKITPSVNGADSVLVLTAVSNENGVDTIVVTATDASAAEVKDSLIITVTSQNDTPTVSAALVDLTVPEDSGNVYHVDLNTVFIDVEDGSALTFAAISQNTNVAMPSINSADSMLILAFPADSSGVTDIEVSATDAGGLVVKDTFQVSINAVNDKPVSADTTVGTAINVIYVFGTSDFPYSDVEGTSIDSIQITTLESIGDLFLDFNGNNVNDAEDIIINDVIAIADISSLKFRPETDSSGTPYATFGYKVHDGTDFSITAYTMTINVSPNSLPTALDTAVTILEDNDYVVDSVDFRFSDIDAGASFDRIVVETVTTKGTLFVDTNLDGIVDGSETIANNDLIYIADISLGKLKYRPAPDSNGTAYDSFVVRVHDGIQAASGTNTFTFNVTPVNDEPLFTVSANITVEEDTGAITKSSWISDGSFGPENESGQVLTYTVVNNDSSLFSVQPAVDVSGNLTFTPAADSNGSATVTIILRDDGGTANSGDNTAPSQNFTITVTPVNDSPVVTSAIQDTATEDIVFQFIGTGTDIESNTTISYVDLPSWLTASNDTLSGTPLNGYIDTSFKVIASDGVLTDTQVITLIVTAINDAPVITSALSDNAIEDIAFSYTATAQDPDNTPTISFENTPSWMTVIGETIKGTPTEGITDTSFNVIASDGVLSDTQIVFVTVTAVNDIPLLISTLPDLEISDTTADTQIVTMTSLFEDPDGDILSYEVRSSGLVDAAIVSGTLTISASGTMTGLDTVVVQAKDPSNQTVTDSMIVTVTQSNQVPVITQKIKDLVLDEDFPGSIAIDLSTIFTDSDNNDVLMFTYTTSEPIITIEIDNSDNLILTSITNAYGTETIIISATDKSNAVVHDTFTVTINEINDQPEIVEPVRDTAGVDDSYKKQFEANDPDNELLTWTIISAPIGMTITPEGLLEWQPERSDIGFHTVYVAATDERDVSDTISYTVTVLRDYVSVLKAPETNKSTLYLFPSILTAEHEEVSIVLKEQNVSSATVKIFDAVGNLLFEGKCYPNGPHFMTTWNGINRNGRKSAGTFLVVCIIEHEDRSRTTQKAILGIAQ